MHDVAPEIALTFSCAGVSLIGVLHPGQVQAQVAVLLVVGGPQYRVGSHRQFVLLARSLARQGIPVLRFDYRGMGDSDGSQRTFESVDDDIESAINALCENLPAVKKIIIWGLCDAASAALFYAHKDPRVSGLVLLNPWVRTDAGMARTYLKHYYLQRFFSVEFWKKLLRGRWNMRASLASFIKFLAKLRKPQSVNEISDSRKTSEVTNTQSSRVPALPDAMRDGWERFNGKVLLILSGNNDYVADEFRDLIKVSRPWRNVLKRASTTRHDFPQANHTFSRNEWRDQVAEWTLSWLTGNKW